MKQASSSLVHSSSLPFPEHGYLGWFPTIGIDLLPPFSSNIRDPIMAKKSRKGGVFENGHVGGAVGGLSLPELNQLELVFLFTTQFDLNVKEEELQRVGNALLRFKNRETATSDSKVSLPAPPAAIAAQVVRTVVVVSNNSIHPNTVNGDGHHILQTNATATTESSSEMIVDPRQQPPRAGRFSIPSPTSPKSGPMSDRGFPQKPIPSLPSSSTSSSSSSSSTATVSSTAIASLHTVSSSAGHSTTVVASGSRSQPPQLLSPPEEKCGGWAEGGTGGESRDVHMATPAPTPSARSSSMPPEPN
ncbi:MAG: hypothetical protein JOS17DRAFT_600151 [Linnemannia elongata]|nr:MAG: hypothetical protein JOS17DRAFT_600151 [Linnemannia elongata]